MKNIKYQGRIVRVTDAEAAKLIQQGGQYASRQAMREQERADREGFAAETLIAPIRRKRTRYGA